jgi:fibronectin type 3 domain-containing protein
MSIFFHFIQKIGIFFPVFFSVFILSCNRDLDIIEGTDTTVNPPETLVITSAHDGTVLLKWNKSNSEILGYNIYLSYSGASGTFENIGNTTNEYYYVLGLEYNITYYFEVTAYNILNESEPSNIVNAKPTNMLYPSIPSGFSVYANYTQNTKSMNLSWYPNPEGDISKYYVYKSDGITMSLIAETQNNNYTDTSGLEIGKRYYYRITAVDKGGLESAPSFVENDVILEKSVLLTPKDKETISKYPTFKWKTVKNAYGYIISLSTAVNGNEIWTKTIEENELEEYSYTLNENILTYGKTYYWKIFTIGKSTAYPNSCSDIKSFYYYPDVP